ncbi:MAG TPA: amino acid permease, partial [Acidimicrobiales bacterium]
MASLKRFVVGKPIATSEEGHQRLGRVVALAVFASDAISSTAYATEEILFVLMAYVMYPGSHRYLMPLAIAAVFLLTVVAISYSQTIHAYPDGGGAYVVSRENINQTTALVAGASLLVDYTLTVAVSVSSGVLAIGSAFHFNDDAPLRIGLALFFVGLMMFGNLRGVKESGRIFAFPTYAYVFFLGTLILYGIFRVDVQHLGPIHASAKEAADYARSQGKHEADLAKSVSLFILLRAFSSGAVVLSGVEAISNGVPAF